MTRAVEDTGAVLGSLGSAESVYREVNGVQLHTVAAGDENDPLVVLLHGYPEFWYSWRDHIQPLAEAGYRVLVPDQRGYNRSEKPQDVASYRVGELAADVAELIGATGRDSAHVIGHDWGGAVAWNVALRHPARVDRLGIINLPHPTVFQDTLTSSLQQLRRSSYMFYYQLPKLPEWSVARNGYRALEEMLRTARSGTFTEEDFDRYRAAWRREGAVSGMLNWYRALFRHTEDPPREAVDAPTLVLWGDGDPYLMPEMAADSLEYCTDGRLERFEDATHWVHHEYPGPVVDHLLDHLAS